MPHLSFFQDLQERRLLNNMAQQNNNKEIYERLRGLETKITRLCATVENVDANQTKLLEKHERALYGNGQTGIITRTDRLEQVEKGRTWSFRAVWGTLITVLGKVVYDVFTH